jgi:large subunit ribosomal protein L15
MGKTSRRGHKGQGQRGTGQPAGFEGGQTPLSKRLPMWGRRPVDQTPFNIISLNKIVYYVRKGFLDASKPITVQDLYQIKAVGQCKYGILITGFGGDVLDFPLQLEVSDVTREAFEKIKEQGGGVKVIYRNKLSMRIHLKPWRYPVPMLPPICNWITVKKMEALRKMGCEVEYNMPDWARMDLEKQESGEADEKKDDFKYPFPRYPGVGAARVRKRKDIIPKTIKIASIDEK